MIAKTQEFNQDLYSSIAKIIVDAKDQVYRNSKTILLKWIGELELIIEDEQNGKLGAEYGQSVLKNLASHLLLEFGKGLMREILIICALFSCIANLERSAYLIVLDLLQNYQQD